jgi:hypothetical protein
MGWLRQLARAGERKCVCRVLMRKTEERRPLDKPSCRWENNIKINIKK